MRVDVPTLRCDRCQTETQDLGEMARFGELRHPHSSGEDRWDLCPPCWTDFHAFIKEPA